ncbi:MAG: methyltransferase [Acidobacteria bacterium]|nr:methyltransferase [Acidobacteriota bacterium]
MSDDFPLRLAGPDVFAAARAFLASSGYCEEFLLRHFELPALHHLLYPYGLQAEYFGRKYAGEGLPLFLARTLLGGYGTDRSEISRYLPDTVFDAMTELGLLRQEQPGQFSAPVILYPAFGLFVASDRGFRQGGPGYRGKDYVMSGIESICTKFIDCIPRTPCRRFLDMGAGAGVAALLGSRFADKVWAIDITPRAVRYAKFNCRLNNALNVDVLQGDLFAPVAGLTFDRIASNPPFEPPLKEGMIFSVGGADGEEIVARLISESPSYLEPGGRMYVQLLGTDREGETFDERIGRWLGAHRTESDVALFVRLSMKPSEYAIQQILGENQDAWKLPEWNMFYHRLKARSVVLGHMMLQKRKTERPTFFVRRTSGPATGIEEMEWLVDWETRCLEPGIGDLLLESKPAPGPAWELHVRHAFRDGELQPLSYTFFNTYPFETSMHCAAWIAMLASRCDGKRTAGEHFEALNGKLHVPKHEFLLALRNLIASDFVRIEGWRTPKTPERIEVEA